MALITRTKPVVVPPTVSIPTRRLRVTANNAGSREAAANLAKEKIDAYLKLISEAYDEIDVAKAKEANALQKIEDLMREHRITDHTNGILEAAIEEHFTRQSRRVDPKKYKANVSSEDFWKSVTVSIGLAETIMTEKELNAISDVIPAKSNGYVLKIRQAKKRLRTE